MDVTRVSVEVATRAPTGRTNAYLLGSETLLLVDPPAEAGVLDDALADRTVDHVAVTHHHPDHVGGVELYARRDDATVWARAGRTDGFRAATGVEHDRTFRPGDTLLVDGDELRVLDAPGHAPEHVALSCDAGTLVGDVVVAAGSVVVGHPEGDMRAYLSTLRRLHARDPPRLYSGHGPVIEGEAVRETVARLVSHRLDRERRVREAAKAGFETVPAITDRAYDKDITGVRDLAEATVAAHLEKLAVEGAVRWDGERALLE
jgi:ribonuclease/clavin/mitogillin